MAVDHTILGEAMPAGPHRTSELSVHWKIPFFPKTEFISNVAKVAGGEGIAQLILALSLPFLARLYAPGEFGIFAVFSAFSAIGTVIGGARYDLAVPTAHENDESWGIVLVTFLVSSAFCCVSTVLYFFWLPEPISHLKWLIVLLPLHALCNTWINGLRYWMARLSLFSDLAYTRITYAFTTLLCQVAFGLLGFDSMGLIIGILIGTFIQLAIFLWRSRTLVGRWPSLKMVLEIASKYSRFPKYVLPGHALNGLSYQLPILFTSRFFGADIAGYFSVCSRILDAPSSFIGRATQQVFFPEAARRYAQDGRCDVMFLRVLRYLLTIGAIGFGSLAIVAPGLAHAAMGPDWEPVGFMCRTLALTYILQFSHFPLASILLIANSQKLEFFWHVFYFILKLGGLSLGLVFDDWRYSIYGFGAGSALAYLVNIMINYQCAKGVAVSAESLSRASE